MMPKLPACTPRDVERALLRAGFSLHHQVGSHRSFRHFTGTPRVTIPMHRHDLKPKTLRAILKQAGLTSKEFHVLLLGERKRSRVA